VKLPKCCRECGCECLSWGYGVSSVQTHAIGYLGCDECSETLLVLPIDEAVSARIEALKEEHAAVCLCRDSDAARCDTEIMSKLRKIAEQAGKRQWWNVMVYIIELNGVALAAMREAVNAKGATT